MALPENRIGTFTFISLMGQPLNLAEEVEVITRKGVDGIAASRTGTRGKQFTLRSSVDAPNKQQAREYVEQYRALIGADPVGLVWSDLDMAIEEFYVLVLDVRPVEVTRLLSATTGLNPPSLGWVECDWDLIAIDSNLNPP
jgi:hypothetical protein